MRLKHWYKKLPRKKKRLVMAAAVAVAIPVVLAVLFDWRIGSIQLRYVFCNLGSGALFGWFCVFGIRKEISQMNKERGCTQAVEATVTGYQQKRVAEPDSGGNMIYGPCFSYVYQGRRSYCLWKYNRFTLKRMLRAYPVGKTVTLYIHPDSPDFVSLKCGLSKGSQFGHAVSMALSGLIHGSLALLGLVGGLVLIFHPGP